MRGMRMVFPDRPIEDLENKDEIFHVLYDLDDRFQVPGEQYVDTGRTYEKDGYVPKWRAIRDDKGRIVVAICHNMHLGDAWEWADSPEYPEQFASMAFRHRAGLHHVRNDALTVTCWAALAESRVRSRSCLNFSSSIRQSIFSKGEFVLLGAWPKWVLLLLMLATAVGTGVLDSLAACRRRLRM